MASLQKGGSELAITFHYIGVCYSTMDRNERGGRHGGCFPLLMRTSISTYNCIQCWSRRHTISPPYSNVSDANPLARHILHPSLIDRSGFLTQEMLVLEAQIEPPSRCIRIS